MVKACSCKQAAHLSGSLLASRNDMTSLQLLHAAILRALYLAWLRQDIVQNLENHDPFCLVSNTLVLIHLKGETCANHVSDLDLFMNQRIFTVIRVADRNYPDKLAEQRGITCVSCEHDEMTPNPGVVTAFLYTLQTAKGGKVAMHSDGSGRAEVLCALHLMHTHGFSAAEAVSWMRLICPGLKLFKEQVDFLTAVGYDLEAAAAAHVERSTALRRGVWRAWAASELRPRRRERPHSSYQLDHAASPPPDRPALARVAAGLARGWLQAASTAAARSLCGRPGGAGGCVGAGEAGAADAAAGRRELPSPLRMQ